MKFYYRMLRKSFLKTIPAAAVLASVPFTGYREPELPVIKPNRLKPGDTIGIIAPGSFITEKELSESAESIKKLGYNVYYTNSVLAKSGYLAGTDKQRTDDIHEMFSSKNVKGIICARGGYGCSRVLPYLDYDLIKNNPKILSGYSDITSLLYGIFAKTGLVCFHGPVGISTYNTYTVNSFNSVLGNPADKITFFSEPENDAGENYKLKTIVSGKCTGTLTGGNLSIAVSMLGTPYDIDTDGKIIFFEETGEEPYRIDRMLTQLLQAEKFDKAAGIMMGIFTGCEPKLKDTSITNSFTLQEVLSDRLSGLKIPVIYGMPFGHVKNKLTLPIGIEAELDTLQQSLTLLEPAVM
jgi:muramoyltetrapeptide carboxypeptidase